MWTQNNLSTELLDVRPNDAIIASHRAAFLCTFVILSFQSPFICQTPFFPSDCFSVLFLSRERVHHLPNVLGTSVSETFE